MRKFLNFVSVFMIIMSLAGCGNSFQIDSAKYEEKLQLLATAVESGMDVYVDGNKVPSTYDFVKLEIQDYEFSMESNVLYITKTLL